MRSGDLVELRPPAEILATLDTNGCTGGLPFMPEMLAFYGRRLEVSARVERACDTQTWSGTRRLENTVTLNDLRCDGSGHDGCAARCRLFWREAWLRRVDGDSRQVLPHVTADPGYAELERVARVGATRSSETSEKVYRCQATELLNASHNVRWWSPVSLVREVSCGNVGLRRFVSVLALAVADRARKRRRRLKLANVERASDAASAAHCSLSIGQCVRVRSREEISRTLDSSGKTRGLHFDFPEMAPYCGKTAPVLATVDRFIDEGSGRMIELKSDAYILRGFACSGDHAPKRWFCPRGIYAWWRESWLEPVEDG
jgi:hypothetical protein